MDPLDLPKHEALVTVALGLMGFGMLNVALVVAVQLLASVTVTVKVPAVRSVRSSLVAPLLQAKAYGVVPPDTVRLTDPLVPAQQVTLVVKTLVEIAVGWLTVAPAVAVQALASVIVTV
jgi:hypothetical protein